MPYAALPTLSVDTVLVDDDEDADVDELEELVVAEVVVVVPADVVASAASAGSFEIVLVMTIGL